MIIPKEFANLVWGDKVPYKKLVEIHDGDDLRFVRISRRNGELVITKGWMMLIREHDLKYKDVVWLKAFDPLKFEVLCFKDIVCGKSFLTAHIKSDCRMCVVPTKFVNDFDCPNLTGQTVKVNFGDKNWNVTMDGDSLLTDGWTKVVEEVPLDKEYFLVFTSIDPSTFEVYVFDPDILTQVYLEKSNADMIIKSKLADVVGSSHVKMRYKAVAGNDVGVLSKDDLKRNSKDVKGKGKVDADQVMKTKKEYQTKRTVRSRSENVHAAAATDSRVMKFTKIAENRIRLPPKVSSELELSPTNLIEVMVKNPKVEIKKLMTRSEKHDTGFRYGFHGWSDYLKGCEITNGDELFFEFHKSTKLLVLSKVVKYVKNKRSRG